MEKKITLATVKKFIRDNKEGLYINVKSNFDGMVDCVMPQDGGFTKIKEAEMNKEYNQGISGAWFVGQSRDYFTNYSDDKFVGIEVYNCCGTFILAVNK